MVGLWRMAVIHLKQSQTSVVMCLWELKQAETCVFECVSLYHTPLSTYACQSAACDLTAGSKSESASGHQNRPKHPLNGHTTSHWACMCLWICKTTMGLSVRVSCLQIRVRSASPPSPCQFRRNMMFQAVWEERQLCYTPLLDSFIFRLSC